MYFYVKNKTPDFDCHTYQLFFDFRSIQNIGFGYKVIEGILDNGNIMQAGE